MEPIDTVPTTPYITKGILGGINTPIEPAEAVIAAANPLSYFFSFIEGIIKEPIAATVAGPEPEIAAKNILANTVTIAKPPAIKPINTVAKFKSLFEIPPWLIKTPDKIKKGIAIKGKLSSDEKAFWIITLGEELVAKTIVTKEATPKDKAIGTPINMRRNIVPKSKAIVILSPPFHKGLYRL